MKSLSRVGWIILDLFKLALDFATNLAVAAGLFAGYYYLLRPLSSVPRFLELTYWEIAVVFLSVILVLLILIRSVDWYIRVLIKMKEYPDDFFPYSRYWINWAAFIGFVFSRFFPLLGVYWWSGEGIRFTSVVFCLKRKQKLFDLLNQEPEDRLSDLNITNPLITKVRSRSPKELEDLKLFVQGYAAYYESGKEEKVSSAEVKAEPVPNLDNPDKVAGVAQAALSGGKRVIFVVFSGDRSPSEVADCLKGTLEITGDQVFSVHFGEPEFAPADVAALGPGGELEPEEEEMLAGAGGDDFDLDDFDSESFHMPDGEDLPDEEIPVSRDDVIELTELADEGVNFLSSPRFLDDEKASCSIKRGGPSEASFVNVGCEGILAVSETIDLEPCLVLSPELFGMAEELARVSQDDEFHKFLVLQEERARAEKKSSLKTTWTAVLNDDLGTYDLPVFISDAFIGGANLAFYSHESKKELIAKGLVEDPLDQVVDQTLGRMGLVLREKPTDLEQILEESDPSGIQLDLVAVDELTLETDKEEIPEASAAGGKEFTLRPIGGEGDSDADGVSGDLGDGDLLDDDFDEDDLSFDFNLDEDPDGLGKNS